MMNGESNSLSPATGDQFKETKKQENYWVLEPVLVGPTDHCQNKKDCAKTDLISTTL